MNLRSQSRSAPAALARLAGEVSAAAPDRFGKHTRSAKVPVRIIKAIRAELERAGIDWRAACATYRAAVPVRAR